MKKNWKTALMTSVAGLALVTGFWSYNQKTERGPDASALIEGIVNVPETENITNRNVIANALIQTAETKTGRKLLEQMYGHYGTNNQTRINMVIEDLGIPTGHRSEEHKIALNSGYLPGGISEYLPYTDIRVTAAHEILHELQARERGTDTVGLTYEDDFREDKLKEAEAKLQNIVIGSEIQDNESSLSPLYNYLTNKLGSRFSQNESESMVKTAFFQCLWQNKGIENAIKSCMGSGISVTDLNKMGINLERCNQEIQEWNVTYNKQATKNAHLNKPLRMEISGANVSYQATEEQQKNIYQSYLSRLNKNGITISMEDVQKGFNVKYQENSNSFNDGTVTIKDSVGEHTFKSCENPTEIGNHKEGSHRVGSSRVFGRLSQASENGKDMSQNNTSNKKLSTTQQTMILSRQSQH